MEIQLIETATAKPVRSVEFETVPEKLRTQLLRQTADLARSSGSFTEAFRAKLLAPKDLSNEMALVTMLLARAQDNAEKKMQQLREAVSLDPFAAEIRAEAEKAGLSPELKNAESKLRSEPYRAAAETRLWFLFYRNLYLYLETFGSESLLDFRVIQKKMNLSQEDRNMMEADLEVRVFRHPEFARYVLSCAKAFQRSVSPAALRRSAQLYTLTDNGQGREDQLLLMRGNGVKPYWEQIFRESQDSGGGDYISWLLGKICRHQMAFEFRLTLKDVETSEKIPEHGRLVFCPAGEVSSEGGRWVLAPAVNYAGEIFVYGLEYNNESQWSRSRKEQKSQGRILPVLSAQENNFRYEDYYRFSFGFPREFQNQQPVLQILEENEFVSPLQPYLDFQTLLK